LGTQYTSPLPGTEPQSAAHAPEFAGEGQTEASVIRRTVEVIGDQSAAMRWLGTPVRALNYATPISLLHDSEGRDAVLSVLGRLEHGVL
jgi:putative toxin-antitoxin system antitoxin component (TIGR02293 family)